MNVSLLSLNVWMGGRLWQPLVNFIQTQAVDLLLLQEIYDGSDPSLVERFRSKSLLESLYPNYSSYFSAIIGDQRPKEGLITNGNLILSRWPMVEKEMLFFDKPYAEYDHDATEDYSSWPAGLQRVVLDLGEGKRLQAANIHGPVWMDGAAPTARRSAMVQAISALFESGLPTIAAGDSNATPDNPCWRELTAPHRSVFGQTLQTTFNMKRKNNPGYANAPVDICFISPDITVIQAECVDVDISDHFPLRVDFTI